MTNFNNLLNSLSFAQLLKSLVFYDAICPPLWEILLSQSSIMVHPLIIVEYYGTSFSHSRVFWDPFSHSRVLWDILQSQSSSMGHPLVIVEQYVISFSRSRVLWDIFYHHPGTPFSQIRVYGTPSVIVGSRGTAFISCQSSLSITGHPESSFSNRHGTSFSLRWSPLESLLSLNQLVFIRCSVVQMETY